MQVQKFYDAGQVALRLGTRTEDVLRWAARPTPAFPIPVCVVIDRQGREKPVWPEGQLPVLRHWLAQRLNLSDPAAHWAMVDRGENSPGGHQDQMAMFKVGTQEQGEPDGLFTF